MAETLEFVVRYGYLMIFLWVLVEQLGLPLPATPLLLAAGALAQRGRMHLPLVILIAAVACIFSDSFWYFFGRTRGAVVLNILCRISLEPDSCVRRTEQTFSKYGRRTLIICKFIPGLNTAAPALAAVANVEYSTFAVFDAIGAVLWSAAFAGLGFLFSRQLDRVVTNVQRLASWLFILFIALVIGYIGWKYNERRRFINQVKGDRITPDELKHQIESGLQVTIIDLRHPLDLLPDPRTLPGALRISPEDLQERNREISRDGEVVLFCT